LIWLFQRKHVADFSEQKNSRRKNKDLVWKSLIFPSRKNHPRRRSVKGEKYSWMMFSAELTAHWLLDRQSVALRLSFIGIYRAGLHSDLGDNRVGLETRRQIGAQRVNQAHRNVRGGADDSPLYHDVGLVIPGYCKSNLGLGDLIAWRQVGDVPGDAGCLRVLGRADERRAIYRDL
jgi:hypothetical protein